MPGKVSGVVEKRREFIAEYESGEWTMTDLSQAHGISRGNRICWRDRASRAQRD